MTVSFKSISLSPFLSMSLPKNNFLVTKHPSYDQPSLLRLSHKKTSGKFLRGTHVHDSRLQVHSHESYTRSFNSDHQVSSHDSPPLHDSYLAYTFSPCSVQAYTQAPTPIKHSLTNSKGSVVNKLRQQNPDLSDLQEKTKNVHNLGSQRPPLRPFHLVPRQQRMQAQPTISRQ